jgi:hypothetical protein
MHVNTLRDSGPGKKHGRLGVPVHAGMKQGKTRCLLCVAKNNSRAGYNSAAVGLSPNDKINISANQY